MLAVQEPVPGFLGADAGVPLGGERGAGIGSSRREAPPSAAARKRSTLELVAGVLKGASERTVCAGGGDASSHQYEFGHSAPFP